MTNRLIPALLCLLSALGLAAQGDDSFYTQFKLGNGLRVIVLNEPTATQVYANCYLDYPIHNEAPKEGTALQTILLMGQGSQTYNAQQIADATHRWNAQLHPYYKGLEAYCSPTHLDSMLCIMAQCIRQPALEGTLPQELLLEQGTTQHISTPEQAANLLLKQSMFGFEHPYGERYRPHISIAPSVDDYRQFHNRYVRPQLLYLTLSGPLDAAQAKELVEKYFGDWQVKTPLFAEYFAPPPPPKGNVVSYITMPNTGEATTWMAGYPISLKMSHPDRASLEILNLLLQQKINQHNPSAFFTRFNPDSNVGTFEASGFAVTAEKAATNMQLLRSAMQELRQTPIEEQTLQAARQQWQTYLENGRTDSYLRSQMARVWVLHKLPSSAWQDELDTINELTPADIQELALSYLFPDQLHIVVVGNGKNAELFKSFTTHGQVLYYDVFGQQMKMVGMLLPEDLSPTKVLQNYLKAIGGEERIATVKEMKAQYRVAGTGFVLAEEKSMPNQFRQEVYRDNQRYAISILQGNEAFRQTADSILPTPPAFLASLQEQALLFPEWHYLNHPSNLRLDGAAVVNGKGVYQLVITRQHGLTVTHYYEINTGLRIRTVFNQQGQISQLDFGDYRPVEGIAFPHRLIATGENGQGFEMELEYIQWNPGINADRFQLQDE
ncbi:MAG: insulinase family protein [Saprospiraceae bacterium]